MEFFFQELSSDIQGRVATGHAIFRELLFSDAGVSVSSLLVMKSFAINKYDNEMQTNVFRPSNQVDVDKQAPHG